ncbi:unnamed protein product [Parnassius apollo]|uniref:(apollo) hypothetical protein n=1 Tax=Parnassius apollo TaxID=110799 RepID=A0A8S3Y037_PARAO|nr:unnamed protein product [Parnassius apollo]
MTHYHYICLNISQSYYKANLGELRRSWKCPLCISITRRTGNNCNTPVQKQLENMDESNMSCEDLTINETAVEISRPVMDTVENTNTSSRCTPAASITLDQFSRLLDFKLDTKLESFQTSLTRTIRKEVSDQIAKIRVHRNDRFSCGGAKGRKS